MSLLSRKGLLAIAAVIDIAMNADGRPVSARALAARHGLPARHLEPVLQALVHDGILKGLRGPRGGYYLARERRRITAEDIVRATALQDDPLELSGSAMVASVVVPAVAQAEQAFSSALAQLSVEELARRAGSSADIAQGGEAE